MFVDNKETRRIKSYFIVELKLKYEFGQNLFVAARSHELIHFITSNYSSYIKSVGFAPFFSRLDCSYFEKKNAQNKNFNRQIIVKEEKSVEILCQPRSSNCFIVVVHQSESK